VKRTPGRRELLPSNVRSDDGKGFDGDEVRACSMEDIIIALM
jgi:hypothetical protein